MKITKLIHSCLLVERGGKKILVDPESEVLEDIVAKEIQI